MTFNSFPDPRNEMLECNYQTELLIGPHVVNMRTVQTASVLVNCPLSDCPLGATFAPVLS